MRSGRKYNNPLVMWADNEETYPELAELAKAFLSIPATSAPSEKVWSRAANVISTKRARLGENVLSGIMFVKENLHVLRKHYAHLTRGDKRALPLEQTGIPLPAQEEVGEIDVGQDLFLANKTF